MMKESKKQLVECVNCGTELVGKFCHKCGEKKVGRSDFALSNFVKEVFEKFTHLDSKLLRSLWLLVSRPGFLTVEYLRGRRKPYMKPLSLFFIINLLYFLTIGFNTLRTYESPLRVLGFLMIVLTAWVAFSAQPPLGEVAYRSFFPEKIDAMAVLTIVGGTVGGYISFAGAHRLLEAGISGRDNIGTVTRSAFTGIGVATLMRMLLFLAAFGVVASGAAIDAANPPASMFRIAASELGYRFFGLVMWSAAVTSVVGCTFTSISFLTSSFSNIEKNKTWLTAGFVAFSVAVFLIVGKPVKMLIAAGAVNGLILPVALAAMLVAARRTELVGGYRLPLGWQIAGWAVVAVMGGMAGWSIWQF